MKERNSTKVILLGKSLFDVEQWIGKIGTTGHAVGLLGRSVWLWASQGKALSRTSSQALGTSCKVVSWLPGGYWWERKGMELTGKGRAVNSSGQHLRSCKMGISKSPGVLCCSCRARGRLHFENGNLERTSVASNFKLLVGSEVWGGTVQWQMEVF